MITFTDAAATKAKQAVGDKALRLSVAGGGCSGYSYRMTPDTEEPKLMDKVYTFGDLKVYVDGISGTFLDGLTVDYKESLEVSGFSFENPSATRTCGCGSSFGV
jgi:iron-sulfur cluster assembly protein